MLTVADQHKIPRLQPIYRSRLKHGNTRTPLATLLEQHPLAKGNAQQGLALSAEHCFSSTSKAIYRYDRNWKLEQEKAIRIEGSTTWEPFITTTVSSGLGYCMDLKRVCMTRN